MNTLLRSGRKISRRFLSNVLNGVMYPYNLRSILSNNKHQLIGSNRAIQTLLYLKYRELIWNKQPLPSFQSIGFSVYSPDETDGILLFLFSLLGDTNRLCIDIGCGAGTNGNTTNLIVNRGWRGLLIDGSEVNTKACRDFFISQKQDEFIPQPVVVNAFVNAENVNVLFQQHGFQGEIDFLSIDIDSIDYWVWKSIDSISPRVVMVECNPYWLHTQAITIPYKSDFIMPPTQPPYVYYGASLAAFVKLGKEKGYRLIGCNRWKYNAFFVRNDLGGDILPEIALDESFDQPPDEKRLKEMNTFEWIKIN